MDAVAFFKRVIDADASLLGLARTKADTPWRAMLIGILWAAVVLLIRFAAASFYHEISGFIILLPGVILAALAGGRVAGVTALAACLAGGWVLVGVTDGGATMGSRLNIVATVNFIIVGLFSTAVAASLRKTLQRLDASIAAQRATDLRDETARIAAEHRISESEARFRTVADSAPVFIWMTDAETRITFANERYRAVFGVELGELLGGRWRKRVHPDDLGPFADAFLKAMKSRARFEAVMRVNHPTDGLRWLRSEGIPRFDATGVFEGYVGASLDITEAKQAQDDLKRINELLEERVGEVLAEKAKAEADLMHAQRMEAVGRLTGGVAHDFNNLLTVVIGALDMILRSPDDAARRKKLGEAALAAARRGEGLTHQLLAFSRRQALRPQPTDLNALVVEGEPLLRRAVGEAIEFRLELRRGGARVSVDPAQFEAALLNLLVNARDAVTSRVSRDGGARGWISLNTSHCEIELGEVLEMAPGDYVCVTVSDNGAGMDDATLARVFEPFFTTKAVGKGTGLGLSQVYGFARQSGGGVRIISGPGEGTEIRLYLPPLDPAEVVAPAVERSASEVIPGGRRLLLVEDDAGVSAIAVELLTGLGLDVEAVETGPDALAALADSRFDVMLSDVVMPGGMTGIELARICAERHPDLRILLTSGYAGDDVDEALSDAPWPFLRKPYSGEQLRDALGDLLPLDQAEA